MNDEIKEILDGLKELDNNYIILKEKGASFKATELEKKAHILYNCITNLQKEVRINNDLIPYLKNKKKSLKKQITNLQEENERLKEDMKIKDDIISINYNKDTKEYTLDRKNYYKINKRLNERLDYKSRVEKAIEYIHNHQLVFELSSKKQIQYWFDMFYEDLLNILKGDDND